MTVRLLVFTSLLLISGGESGSGSTKRRSPQASSSSSSSSGGGTPVDFDCPEEFGYYAHPTDCTQYYVCVFGGALLESCTGGLMYSHELQTCDWPRNVGCAPGTAASQQVQQVPETRQRQSSPPQRERIIQQQIPKHDLYTEDEQLPAEELDSDRQQRVYRGQPQAIGQVQSDRDGLAPHSNAIPVPGRGKLSVVSYGTQQQYTRASVTPAQQQYVEQQTTQQQTTPPRAYNQSRYVPSQYDPPFYSLYDDEVDLYKEIGDYTQYNTQGGNQYRNQGTYKEKKPQIEIVQQEPVRGSAYSKNKYNSQSDIYQTVTPQEYESYSIQTNDDLPYRQPQQTKSSTRGGSRHRGSQSFTISPNDAEPAPQPNRGTPAAPRVRPTLKPSTTVVGKASEYFDIYRYPPRRPDNVYPTPQVDKTAAKCRKDVCLIPDCSCGGKDIPGELTLEETPQIVLLTFDDSVNDLNKGLYEDLFEKGRVNPNGCPISGTFYVSHEWTDYSQVQNLYSNGHEIASHSVSHSFGEQFSQKKWTKEISGQREILSAYGGVKMEDIRGMRAPFLAIGGNKMFKMLYDSNFTYDSSMPVYENRPPSWPYTMDYKIFHDCMIPPCPTKSYPGVWEVPMVMWQDLNGGRCSMGDACSNPPNAEGVYKMLIKNFERHFTTNRAPFGLFYHAAWFTQPHHKEGFIAFLDTINKMPEVWLVTNWQAIQWVRDPTPINRLNNFAPFSCNYQDRPKKCNNPKVCNLWHKSGVRYMRTCQPCPDVYPWTGKSGVRNSRVDNEIINE
uniref:Chitin-binding type-2 domain-containing protein n=2 Tax=Lygus hesperus TaxID=30085 RepID=A0A0K8SHL0_LYGHE